MIDAFEESKHIYIEGTNLLERLYKQKKLTIGETGFGAGRNLLVLLKILSETKLKEKEIIYNSVELYPLSAVRISSILNNFREKADYLVDLLLEKYQKFDFTSSSCQRTTITLPFGYLKLNLWFGEAMELVKNLDSKCDIWFLDGHAPKKNPQIWRPELLAEIGKMTNKNGIFSTFTVAVAINKALIEAGFQTEQFPGHGRKRVFLRGIKTGD